jgi:hypothetical protein
VGLWLKLRLKSDEGGICQVFYFMEGQGATEADSIRFAVPAGEWFEARARLPALGPRYRLRIDPPGTGGVCLISSLHFERRVEIAAPDWPKPELPRLRPEDPRIESAELQVVQGGDFIGQFEVRVAGERMAVGHSSPLVGYLHNTTPRWFWLRNNTSIRFDKISGGFAITAIHSDEDMGQWEIRQQFSSGPRPGTISVEVRVTVSQERLVVYLPLLTLLPGLGSFGTNKTQALFAGVEYLENEPSSSEADLRSCGPAASARCAQVDVAVDGALRERKVRRPDLGTAFQLCRML